MVLTPQMKQSLQLLSMSTQNLNEYIESALASNPFLKKEFDKKVTQKYSDSDYDYTANIAQKQDPRASLLSQVKMLDLGDKELEIAEYLVYEIDDNGYITVALEEMASALSVDINEIEKILNIIQDMEPAGIGARNVSECLMIQLKKRGKKDSLEYIICADHINEVARNDVDKISKALGKSKTDVQNALKTIKKLNPRPASGMLSEEAQKVAPDLVVERDKKGICLKLNRGWMPQLKFYNPYETESDISQDPEAKKFIKENRDSAKHLIDGLKRREETMCKVAGYILNFQKKCITDGAEIKSLSMKDVARSVGVHPSTISRTVSNKYIEVNDEVIPLKTFLSRAMKKAGGEITSKAAVKKKIEMLIKNENKAHPLSDETVRKELEKDGLSIKRRTIAKYRNSLRILPTHLRKK